MSQAFQTVKARASWTHWAGSPDDLAEIGELAEELVAKEASAVSFSAEVFARAFDARYLAPEQLRTGLEPEDLAELSAIELTVEQADAAEVPARVAVTVTRPQQPTREGKDVEPAVKLAVTGPDRDWVDLATLRLSERIERGARATGKATKAMVAGFLGSLGLAIGVIVAWGDDRAGLNAAEITSIVLFSLSGLFLLGLGSVDTITPRLELLPESGMTRWVRLKQRSRISGRWLLDTALKAAIGAFIALLVQRI